MSFRCCRDNWQYRHDSNSIQSNSNLFALLPIQFMQESDLFALDMFQLGNLPLLTSWQESPSNLHHQPNERNSHRQNRYTSKFQPPLRIRRSITYDLACARMQQILSSTDYPAFLFHAAELSFKRQAFHLLFLQIYLTVLERNILLI